MTLILLLGFVLRVVNLNQSLWLDEAVQAITSKGSFSNIFSELQGDFHPSLYHLLMWGWVHLFGSSEIVLRLPSVIFGTITVWVVYLIAKYFTSGESSLRLCSGRVGHSRGVRSLVPQIVALLLATAPFHIYYSQEARPYALVALLTSCSFYFLLKQKWLGYVAVTALALYSSYYVLFVMFAQGVGMLLTERNKIVRLLYCYAAVLFLFVPWLPMFLKQIQVGQMALISLPEWGNLVNADFAKAIPLTFIKFMLGRITIFDKVLYAIVGSLVSLVYGMVIIKGLLGYFIHLRRVDSAPSDGASQHLGGGHELDSSEVNRYFLIAIWFVVPIFFAWILSFFTPNYQPFRLLFVLPAFYLLLTFGIFKFSNNKARIGLVTFVIFVNLTALYTYYSNSFFHREDWRRVVQFIEAQNNAVAILPSETSNWPWQYYSSKRAELTSVSRGERQVSQEDLDNLTTLITKREGTSLTIYYIRYLQPLFDPQEKIVSWLEKSGYNKRREISFNQIPIWEY